MIGPSGGSFLGRVWRYLRAPFSTRDWSVILFEGLSVSSLDIEQLRRSRGKVFRAPGWRWFWADPCIVLGDDGLLWLFVEEFDRLRGLGRIKALCVLDGRALIDVVVLDGPHHRAFPRVWRDAGRWWATVDGCEFPPKVYTFGTLGDPWRPSEGASLPGALTDPDVSRTEEGWTVTGTDWFVDEASHAEVWFADTLEGDWIRVPEYCYEDPALARGAGGADWGRGLRAVQDGTAAYGSAVSLIRWPLRNGRVEVVTRVDGSTFGTTGTHTLAWDRDGSSVVVDVWRRRFDPFGWLWKLTDLRHLKACRRSVRPATEN